MEDDFYQPPQSNVNRVSSQRGSPVKAVVVATLMDIGLSFLVTLFVVLSYGWFVTKSGVTWEAFFEQVALMEIISPLSIVSLSLGALITVYSANLCARIVNYSEYRYVSVFALSIVLFNLLVDSTYYSLVEHMILTTISLFCVYFGAWLHVRKKPREGRG